MQISHRCASPRFAAKSTTPNNFQNLAGLLLLHAFEFYTRIYCEVNSDIYKQAFDMTIKVLYNKRIYCEYT